MLQDISPKKLLNQYDVNAVIDSNDVIINLYEGNVICKTSPELDYPTYSLYQNEYKKEDFIYLFSIDNVRYFLYNKSALPEVAGYRSNTFNSLRGIVIKPRHQLYAIYTAKHLNDWYNDNKYCGRCGKEMKHSTTERCRICDCGYHSYPRIMPAVIVGVTNKDKILLTKYRTGYAHYALVAGFVEIGETVEETVIREVKEETGLNVKNIRYYKSQPWGVANDILLGYYCDVDGDDTINMDNNELKYAAWVKKEDIEFQPDDISLTNEMMKNFANQL